jgi:hypothetical protein
MERWFERLFTVFPDLSFEVESISVSGPPWDMWVAIEDRPGQSPRRLGYENRGSHWIRLQRGKATH